jgi:hypothetical protein
VVEIAHDAEARGRCRGLFFADRAEGFADLAHVCGTELESKRRVDTHGVEILAADKLDARDERLRRADIFLDQRHAVDRILECGAVDVSPKCIDALKKLHAEALAGAVVLGDERNADLVRGPQDGLAPDGRDRSRSADAVGGERRILLDLAHLELQSAPAVDDAAAMHFQPCEHTRRQLGGVPVAAGMRRGAHAVVEHALRRRLVEVEAPLAQEPFLIRQTERGECNAQRLDPGVVFVNDIDLRHSTLAVSEPRSLVTRAPRALHATR